MRRWHKISTGLLVLVVALASFTPARVRAEGPSFVLVRWGDTLYSIAARNSTTVDALLNANHLPNPNFIFAGQRLVIPNSSPAQAPPARGLYIVRPGDTLFSIAVRNLTTVRALMLANGLANPSFIYSGQRLNLPNLGTTPLTPPGQPPASPAVGKWIDVNIGAQRFMAYEGTVAVRSALVSTGVAGHPTPIGRFATYVKLKSQTMFGGSKAAGDYYYLPNVPNVMYFYRDYALHGTYWHNNFGRPMSRGCVNLTLADAEWLFNWAPLGTPVVTHN